MNATVFRGACHCGAVKFEVETALEGAGRCNCSLCRRRGALMSPMFDAARLTILEGEDALTLYQFNTRVAKHYFCSRCGIYTHHQRRSNPGEYGVNAACLDGVSPFDFAEVQVNDGVRHPSDTGRSSVAGVLKFIPAK